MALTQLAPPYPVFTDKNGDPLDNGYLYFGEVNKNPETNPIQVYYDSAFTQPAAQPLRTSNGYVMRNGSPALIYAGSQFSVTVRDKNNALVIYSPVGYGIDPGSVTGTVVYDDFTGDGATVNFTLSASPSTKNATNVYIDGVYQSKDNYDVSGSTLTFSTAPPLNSAIEVVTQESSIIGGASSQQISYTQGGVGSVTRTVQSRLRDFVSVKDFGAVGDGVTDDTAAIQAAIATLLEASVTVKEGQVFSNILTGTVYFPKGTYAISSSIQLNNAYGVRLLGDGYPATRLLWTGSSGTAVELNDCVQCSVEQMEVYADPSSTLDCGFSSIQSVAFSILAPTSNIFYNCYVTGNEVTTDAYKVDFTTATAANNDFMEFNSCGARGYSNAAFYLRGLQSHCIYIRNVNVNGGDLTYSSRFSDYGVYSAAAVAGQGVPSFIVDGGALGWHDVADYYIGGGAVNGSIIKNISSENSDRLLTSDLYGGSNNTLLENVRFASDGLNADGYMIRYQLSGVLTIQSCHLGTNGTSSTAEPKIFLANNNAISATIRDTRFSYGNTSTGQNSTQFNPVVVDNTVSQYGVASISMQNCTFQNAVVTTMSGYLNKTGTPASPVTLNARFGDAQFFLAYGAATDVSNMTATYPNQEVEFVFKNTNATIKHAATGAGQFFLASGADFTPTIVPSAKRFRYNTDFNVWYEI